MAFTDNLLKSTLQKAFEIQKWAILGGHYKQTGLPACEVDTLTYRFSVEIELNLYDILDQLRHDGQGDYAKELEKNKDKLLERVQSFNENIDKNHKSHLPNFCLGNMAHGLFKKLRRIVEEQTDDNKKLLLYAECIEDLIKDNTKLYPQIWRGEFEKLLDIVVSHIQGYDLFGELLGRIKEKDPTAAAQLKEKYDQLTILSNVENARKDELKAVKSAALNLVSLMRKPAKIRQETGGSNAGDTPVTLREFINDHCEHVSNNMLESRVQSLQSLAQRKLITLRHTGKWTSGQSKKYLPSYLKSNWKTFTKKLPSLPKLKLS